MDTFQTVSKCADYHPELPLDYEIQSSKTILKQTHNATLLTLCNLSFVVQSIHTKLGICV